MLLHSVSTRDRLWPVRNSASNKSDADDQSGHNIFCGALHSHVRLDHTSLELHAGGSVNHMGFGLRASLGNFDPMPFSPVGCHVL